MNYYIKKSLIVLVLLVPCLISAQQTGYRQRTDFNALMEPESGILNGAGQSPDAFKKYSDVMPDGMKPVIYMTYVGLDGNILEWAGKLKKEIEKYPWYIIPQIGLAMTHDGSPEKHYEQVVAAGGFDKQIDTFVMALNFIDRPSYVRIGYEFSGQWNGYVAESYREAFARVARAMRKGSVNPAATVWCMSPDANNKDFMSFYPGDDLVDWWCIDIFSHWHCSDSIAVAFMNGSLDHHKPLMIGESTPRGVGVEKADSSWQKWFYPYFRLIADYPNMKAFCYINWNWAKYPKWGDWGNGRIEDNEYVSRHFVKEISHKYYIHGADEPSTRSFLRVPQGKK
jgi:hypothetical protein